MLFNLFVLNFQMLTIKYSVCLLSNCFTTLKMTFELIKKLNIPKTLVPLSDKLKSDRPFVSTKNNAI